jgi:hypothetical protein
VYTARSKPAPVPAGIVMEEQQMTQYRLSIYQPDGSTSPEVPGPGMGDVSTLNQQVKAAEVRSFQVDPGD